MSYNKHKWVNNVDAVDEDKMNHIENGIKDLDDNKVNKSGDTLTGGLMFENKDGYDAIRKTRTIDNEDYSLSVGVGANKSARLELYQGSTTLGQLDVRSDGVYNGKTGKKLAEQSTGWSTPTLSNYIKGNVRYTRVGNAVFVMFSDVQIKSNLNHGTILASGLPKSTDYIITVLNNFDVPGKPMRIGIDKSGQIVDHYATLASSSNSYYGTLVYITNQ